ncbi:MAG: hypothetical protein WCJ57_01890 [Candidatus Falkowbacteria bacterium]
MEKTKQSEKPVEAVSERKKMIDIDELVTGSIRIYKEHFKKFILMMLISLASYVPFYLISEWLSVNTNIILGIILVVLFVLSILVLIYFGVRSQIGMYFILKNPKMEIKELFASTKTLFWKFFGLSLLTGILVFLWTLLLIIPGIIFGVFYCFASYLLIFEDVKGMNAIKRSKALVTGYWWAVFGRTMFAILVAMLASFVLSIPFIFLSEGSILYTIYSLLQNIAWAVVTPIFMIFTYLMYKDLRHIKG